MSEGRSKTIIEKMMPISLLTSTRETKAQLKQITKKVPGLLKKLSFFGRKPANLDTLSNKDKSSSSSHHTESEKRVSESLDFEGTSSEN